MARFFDQFTHLPPKNSISTPPPEHTKVQQHFAEQLEINRIMRRALNGGSLPAPTTAPVFGDFRHRDLADAYDIVSRAEEAFAQLPSDVRSRFENDPLGVVSFVEDENNRDEAIKIGLLPKPVPPPVSSPVHESQEA